MQVVRHLDEQIWREFVYQHPQGNIFHTPEMFRVFSETKGYRPELWAVVGNNQRPLALFMPVAITLMGGLPAWFTTRAVAHGSVLCDPGPQGPEALAMLLQAYRRGVDRRVLFTELRNLADLSHLRPVFEASSYVYEEHLNFWIDLNRSPEELLQSIGARTRKNIRRGLRKGDVQVYEVADRTELSKWYRVLQMTYQAARVPLADRTLFEAVFNHLGPENMARFMLAKVNERPAACSLELPYRDTIYGWYGGTDRRFGKYNPNELLNWHILEWGALNGYAMYDFGGAGKPDEEYGVRDFKAKFGGKLVRLGRYTCVHAPYRLKLSALVFDLYQRLLGVVPQ